VRSRERAVEVRGPSRARCQLAGVRGSNRGGRPRSGSGSAGRWSSCRGSMRRRRRDSSAGRCFANSAGWRWPTRSRRGSHGRAARARAPSSGQWRGGWWEMAPSTALTRRG
jgi:hypothetical protein